MFEATSLISALTSMVTLAAPLTDGTPFRG